jgi:hypothetical protein
MAAPGTGTGPSSTCTAKAATAVLPAPLDECPCLWVDTPGKLQVMLSELQGVPVIAVDTEHNAHRSYLGMTCLLQLSTGRGGWGVVFVSGTLLHLSQLAYTDLSQRFCRTLGHVSICMSLRGRDVDGSWFTFVVAAAAE